MHTMTNATIRLRMMSTSMTIMIMTILLYTMNTTMNMVDMLTGRAVMVGMVMNMAW